MLGVWQTVCMVFGGDVVRFYIPLSLGQTSSRSRPGSPKGQRHRTNVYVCLIHEYLMSSHVIDPQSWMIIVPPHLYREPCQSGLRDRPLSYHNFR